MERFWSFKISKDTKRFQKSSVGLDIFSNQLLIYLAPLDNNSLLIDYPVDKLRSFKSSGSCMIFVIPFGFMLSNLKDH